MKNKFRIKYNRLSKFKLCFLTFWIAWLNPRGPAEPLRASTRFGGSFYLAQRTLRAPSPRSPRAKRRERQNQNTRLTKNCINSLFKMIFNSFILFIVLSTPVFACSIPVFQYALARWQADAYEVIVFHRGNMSLSEQTNINQLKSSYSGENSYANILVKTIDLDSSQSETEQKLWQSQQNPELPWMIVRIPYYFSGSSELIWSGRLTTTNVQALVNSPIRKEIARRILNGEAAVWILLESGNASEDESAARLLETQLDRLEDKLEIVTSSGQFDSLPRGNTTERDSKVSFSMLRLSRNEPKESILIQMLLSTEWGLKDISKPMAFPVFGRGRVLYALAGDGINENNIFEACSFIIGWCSCQVKELNPGIDLLMSVNWEENIDEQLISAVNYDPFAYNEIPVISENLEPTDTSDRKSGNLKRNIVIAVLIQLIIVAVVTTILFRRKKDSS